MYHGFSVHHLCCQFPGSELIFFPGLDVSTAEQLQEQGDLLEHPVRIEVEFCPGWCFSLTLLLVANVWCATVRALTGGCALVVPLQEWRLCTREVCFMPLAH